MFYSYLQGVQFMNNLFTQSELDPVYFPFHGIISGSTQTNFIITREVKADTVHVIPF